MVCPRCGEDNPERARFCLNCGMALLAEPTRQGEVRKTVTVLFCDVTGSTSLGERLDPEALRGVMSRYFEAVSTVLERHGGRVEKFIGDAVMAVFGIPALHEDDALRAARAAWGLRAALEGLNRELQRDFGVAIEVRTGVNTGEVVAGDPSAGQALVTGDAVNSAARLEQNAGPGEVLIGEATYRLVRDAVKVEHVEVEAKGKAETIAAFRLLEVLPGAPAFARRLDSPMVGRDRELRLLADAFERVVSERGCHLFTILGAAGVGKSRLVYEFLRMVADRSRVLRGRCLPYGDGITFWPAAEVVKQAAGISEEDSPDEARAKLAVLVEEEEQGDIIAQRVGQAIGLVKDSALQEETFWSVRKLLEVLAGRDPLVIVFDDIHWGEPAFLDLVEHVADWSRDAPILLLCLTRAELLDRRPAWGGGKLNATSMHLEPLSEDECEALLANLLGASRVPEEVSHRITESAEGNPLFVEEMLFMLMDEGLLTPSDGHWEPVGDLSGVAVPPTIQALLASRLDRLGHEERAVIERAAVVGKVFYRGAVAELCPDPLRSEVTTHLMTLVRKELIRPHPSEFGEDAFRFRHLLIRDSAYEAMPKQLRAELHERFAAWMERAAGDRITEYEEILGYHLEQACRLRQAVGAMDERIRGIGDRAAGWLGAAGTRALGRGDLSAARGLLSRAASLASPGAPRLRHWLAGLGEALKEGGELQGAEEVLDRALAESAAAADEGAAARARLLGISVRIMRDPTTPERALLEGAEQAVAVYERLGDEEGQAWAWNVLAQSLFFLGRSQDSAEAYERARRYADAAGEPRLAIEALWQTVTQGIFGYLPSREGLTLCDQLLHRFPGEPMVEASGWGARAAYLAMLGRLDEARDDVARSLRRFEDLGQWVQLSNARSMIASPIALLAGDLDSAERLAREGVERLSRMGETGYLSTAVCYLARALLEQGQLEEAERLTEISERSAAADDIASQLHWRGLRAVVKARRGELDPAETLAREGVRMAEGTDYLEMIGDAIMDLAEVVRLAGRPAEAVPLVQRAIELYEEKEHLVKARKARELLASLARG